ncbi:MlaA family lipoprotein [Marinobacterium jannaschii]|uniref:MlaA family lipoprotein n=1 Tax=Marinobacterium jannaschii TaxID=64970 RepID=UPI0004836938|nr:VacJ family lipoprotein [Marinobacterium jannaschii]
MKQMLLKLVAVGVIASAVSVPVFAEEAEVDPWEGMNRSIFAFNEGFDRYLLKPATLGYKAVTPDVVETGVSNFFGNISDIGSFVNNVLQAKFEPALNDFARLTFNTTIGLAGFIDVATPMGLPETDEDFGQTLGYWGFESGPYLMLPFFGPSTVRDGVGFVAESVTSPYNNLEDDTLRYSLTALRAIDQRAGLLEAERLISGDKYLFIRNLYLQRREFQVNDGQLESFDDDDF